MECIRETFYDIFSCNDCPIKKYNCCEATEENFKKLKYRIDLDIQRLEEYREKAIDKIE